MLWLPSFNLSCNSYLTSQFGSASIQKEKSYSHHHPMLNFGSFKTCLSLELATLTTPVPKLLCHGICHDSDVSLAIHHVPYETTCNQMPRTMPLHTVDRLPSPLASSLTVRGLSVQAQLLPFCPREKNERRHAPRCHSPNSMHTTISPCACLSHTHGYSVFCCHHLHGSHLL